MIAGDDDSLSLTRFVAEAPDDGAAGTVIDDGETLRYLASTSDCRGCPLKARCCPTAPFRRIRAASMKRRATLGDGISMSVHERHKVRQQWLVCEGILVGDIVSLNLSQVLILGDDLWTADYGSQKAIKLL